MLGSSNFDLSKYVGKVYEEATLPLYGGPIENGTVKLAISIVTIPKADLVGVDPMTLLDGVPPQMKQILKLQIDA